MYGIEENDRLYIDLMLRKQKDYIEDNEFSTMSANIVPHKYIAELNNRIDAIIKIAQDDRCVPIFITITAPSQYHPTSKRFNNESPHAVSLYLSHIWAKLLRSNVFKRLKRFGGNKHYFRTYEPHKSGVPHLHALFYIPKAFLLDFKKAFLLLMQKENIKQYKFLFQFKKAGYNSNFEGSRAYILKYILKSLKSAKDGKMTDIAYWYIKHKIRRFITSNSLAPLFIFRKIKYIDNLQSLYKVTLHYRSKRLVLSGYKTCIDLFVFNKDDCVYEDKLLWSKPIKSTSIKRDVLKFVAPFVKEKKKSLVPVYNQYNDFIGHFKDNDFIKTPYKYSFYNQYSDLELFELIQTLDNMIDLDFDVNLTRYGVFKEEAKRRGILSGDLIPINDYDDSFDFIDIFLE